MSEGLFTFHIKKPNQVKTMKSEKKCEKLRTDSYSCQRLFVIYLHCYENNTDHANSIRVDSEYRAYKKTIY